jgi:mannose-6-phosphate isomerase-like protein (cupin superfamily)
VERQARAADLPIPSRHVPGSTINCGTQARDYETVGYVISGRAELHSEGQMVLLEPGNCWVVPRHALHTYKILEPFTAIEATHPPAEIHDRDHPAGQ